MYAKLHAQQLQEQPGTRAHVVDSKAQPAGGSSHEGLGTGAHLPEGGSAGTGAGAAVAECLNDVVAEPHTS